MGKKEKIVKMAQLEKTNRAKKELKMAKISKKNKLKNECRRKYMENIYTHKNKKRADTFVTAKKAVRRQ